jgi:hypothetical protein
MALSDILNMTITLKSSVPTKAGFGRSMIAGYHTRFVGRSRLYTTADAMLVDGFVTTDHLYKLASAVKNQGAKDFKIGRCALAYTQLVEFVPSNTTQGFVYSGKINGVAWSYTVLAAATLASVCTALAALWTGLSGTGFTYTGASGTKVVATASTPGTMKQFTEVVPELRITETTADAGIATDLAAIHNADSDWFGLLLDSNSEAQVNATASWIESKRKMYFYPTADYGCKDAAVTTDVMSDIKAADYFNTAGFWHQDVGSMIAAGFQGAHLLTLPGTATLAFKSAKGVTPSDTAANGTQYITDAEDANVQAKSGNTYRTIAGNGTLWEGKCGGQDYVDAVRFIHFMYARITESVIFTFQNNPRIPYSDAGIEIMKSAILNPLLSWTKKPYEALSTAAGEAPFVQAPKASEVAEADRINRLLPDVTFSARYLGAIHKMVVTGTVSL